MTHNTSTGPTRRPTLGLIAQIAGVIGAIACVIAIIAVMTGRSWVQERVEVLSKSATNALDQAVGVSDTVLTGLADGAARVTEIRTSAEGLAANPALDEAAISALQQRLAPLAERYQGARERYVTFREKAANLIDTVQRLDTMLPGIDLPDGPVGLVAGMDEKLTALDQAISDLSSRAAERTGANATATAIATAAGRLEEGFGAATQLTQDIQADIMGMQDSVEDVADRVGGLIGLGAIGIALVFAWVLVLNLALVALGRRWRAA